MLSAEQRAQGAEIRVNCEVLAVRLSGEEITEVDNQEKTDSTKDVPLSRRELKRQAKLEKISVR